MRGQNHEILSAGGILYYIYQSKQQTNRDPTMVVRGVWQVMYILFDPWIDHKHIIGINIYSGRKSNVDKSRARTLRPYIPFSWKMLDFLLE